MTKLKFIGKLRWRSILALLLGAPLVLAAPPTWSQTADDHAPLRIVTSFATTGLNPAQQNISVGNWGIAETLMEFRADGLFHPHLLESAEIVNDTTWRLIIRPGITFQNGKPLNAETALDSITYQLENSTAARGLFPADIAFAATGPLELSVTSPRPFPGLPGALSHFAMPIYDAEAVRAAESDLSQLEDAGIYTGPYHMMSLTEDELTAVRNDDYWQGTPALPGISVQFVSDPNARILAVQNGEADIALYPPTVAKPVVDQAQGIHFNHGTPNLGGFVLFLNLNEPPFDDLLVRQAIIKAFDYEEISDVVFNGLLDTASGFYPPLLPWALGNQETDIEGAVALLDQAGWTVGVDGLRQKDGAPLQFTLMIYPQQPDLVPLSTAMQAQLRQLGIDVRIATVEAIYDGFAGSIDWHAGLSSETTAAAGTPETFLRRYIVTGAERNFGGYSNEEIDRLSVELEGTIDEGARMTLLHRIQEILVEEDPYAFNMNHHQGRVIVNDLYRSYPAPFSTTFLNWQTQPG